MRRLNAASQMWRERLESQAHFCESQGRFRDT